MKYLVKITPLEAYSFGNDQNFVYPDEKGSGKESYFVRSKYVPEQTTILGLLRYLILQENGLLRTDFHYTPEEREMMKKCIGEKSFSYQETEKQDFGFIHNISPLFIVNEKEEILVKNPYHNKAVKKGYEPMKMENNIQTSYGTISLPAKDAYDAKNGYANGYMNLSTQEIVTDLFDTQIVSGNRKNDKNEDDKDGFFKRELVNLKTGYSFAVYVEAENLPHKTVGYMGKKKSAFLIETKNVDDVNLDEKVQQCFKGEEIWFYALSDIVLQEPLEHKDFCIIEEKYQRNLETVYDAKDSLKKLKKNEIRHHLIQSGSVFFNEMNVCLEHPNAQQIGYNKIVQLGGQ